LLNGPATASFPSAASLFIFAMCPANSLLTSALSSIFVGPVLKKAIFLFRLLRRRAENAQA